MRRNRAIAGRNIVVQLILVTWDKSGRGGRGAERRNRIPLALPLPDQLRPEIGRHLLLHESHWGHTNQFACECASEFRSKDHSAEYRYKCISVAAIDGGAQVDWTWNEWGGIPPRTIWADDGNVVPANHHIDLKDNEWARLRWNGRFTCIDTGSWWYESVVANVGVLPDAEIPSDFFTRCEPIEDYSQMAQLR
jgi:hypothetical protein